jgi:hypothetical protein
MWPAFDGLQRDGPGEDAFDGLTREHIARNTTRRRGLPQQEQ